MHQTKPIRLFDTGTNDRQLSHTMFKRQESDKSRVLLLNEMTKQPSSHASIALKQPVRRKGYVYDQPDEKDRKRAKTTEEDKVEDEEDELTKHFNFIVNSALYQSVITDTDAIYGPGHPSKEKYRVLQV